MNSKLKKENIINIPNFLTLSRVIITFVILYLIFAGFNLVSVVVLFVAGMITDILDGQIARRYKLKTEFGRRFDMVADRFLFVGTILGIVIYNTKTGYFGKYELLLILLILTREIIGFPFAIASFFSGNFLPNARFVAKLTTTLQGFAFPMILLKWDMAMFFVVPAFVCGIISGLYYMRDSLALDSKK